MVLGEVSEVGEYCLLFEVDLEDPNFFSFSLGELDSKLSDWG